MINVQVQKNRCPGSDQLERLRQYASVPTDQRDALLMRCLTQALLAVQAHADTALLPCTLRMTVTDITSGESVKLYQGGCRVLSVKDQDGHDLSCLQDGGRLVFQQSAKSAVVTYENRVLPGELMKLEPVVWQYATALYDGEDAATLTNILKTTYGCL